MPVTAALVRPSPPAAFVALVAFAFRRQARVGEIGWAAVGLLGVLAVVVAVLTYGSSGWGLRERVNRPFRVDVRAIEKAFGADAAAAYREKHKPQIDSRYGDLPDQYAPLAAVPPTAFAIQAAAFGPVLYLIREERFLADWAFLNFSRWVVFAMYLGFLLPLVTLAYGTAAVGAEREGRTLIWLTTRPLPRGAVYLALFLGALPWCLLASVGGFAVLCLAGGDLGRRAFAVYWPAAVVGTVAFAALFHLIGATFRRPAVVGLLYVFFFEVLVANLPGSLKQLSLNYYARSLLYNEATGAVTTVLPESLDVYDPADPTTAWVTLLAATVVLTSVGMWLFGRQEPRDET